MTENIKLAYQGASAEVCLHGAEIISYIDNDGREYIWQADPNVWGEHAPILFPVCGKAKDDCIKIDGIAYPMPKHGFACKSDFKVHALGANYVDLILESSNQTKTMFPFDFALHVVYKIEKHAFTTEFIVENRSNAVMPFCIGGHPGLNFPFRDEANQNPILTFSAPVANKLDVVIDGGYIQGKETFDALEEGTTISLTHQMIDKRDTLLFSNIGCQTVSMCTPDNELRLRMNISDFPNLAIWSMGGKNADYVCLEPWQGLPASPDESGELSEKPFAVCLPANQVYRSAFTVEKI